MSLALVRQALELVDPEERLVKKRTARPRRATAQDRRPLIKSKNRRNKEVIKSKEEITEQNIKKLLALSKPTVESAVTEKIVERAIKQKPLADTPQTKADNNKSILFPEPESFKNFETELFCS